jgi:hypothetical protein
MQITRFEFFFCKQIVDNKEKKIFLDKIWIQYEYFVSLHLDL